VTRR